ncbi:MAG: flippase-like domain-containing protein [Planctomycetaceae bacterium]|mgnify:CR=1 FL=1|nr:flippase-like domain-containing protein [Planctomycetaceae bacterium]
MAKKALTLVFKIVLPLAILAYLVWNAQREDAFTDLIRQPKNWPLLALALLSCSTAVMLTMIRWRYLVRALDIPFTVREALRFGFLGYLFNLAPMGIVGGDLLKAYLLAQHHPSKKTAAVASVFVDRIIGLYALFVVASAAILLTGFAATGNEWVRWICRVTHTITIVGTAGMIAVLMPDLSRGGSTRLLAKTPLIGPTLEKVLLALAMYRRRWPVVVGASLMSVAVHSFFSIGIFLICSALYQTVPALRMHFVISPLSAALGVIPLPAGPLEGGLDWLYAQVPAASGAAIALGQGLVVALTYRTITVVIATVGFGYYLGSREEVSEAIHEVDEVTHTPLPDHYSVVDDEGPSLAEPAA